MSDRCDETKLEMLRRYSSITNETDIYDIIVEEFAEDNIEDYIIYSGRSICDEELEIHKGLIKDLLLKNKEILGSAIDRSINNVIISHFDNYDKRFRDSNK